MNEDLEATAAAALASRLVVGLAGPEPTPAEWAWLARYRPAGVILFGRNVTDPAQAQSLCARLRALVPGLEVMVDHEGGPVAQMAAAAGRPPAAWALGALDDVELTREVCRETGARLAQLGVTRVLGPVADVLEHPRNPVIGARAFGGDASLCARHVAAAVRGYRQAGLNVCVKHWPGHGGTATDSHLSLEAQLVSGCREPFVAGLAAGADAVMVGHLPVAASDGGASLPATLDAGYLAGARAALSAGGGPPLLVADDVTMGALRLPMKQAGVPDPDGLEGGLVDPGLLPAAWLQALVTAGCDLLLIRGIPWRALPAGDDAAAPAAVPGMVAPEGLDALTDEALTVEAPAWRAARARLWAVAAAGWADPDLDLGWIDATTGDRWGAADARSGAAFTARLGRLFAAVRHVDGDPAGAGFRPVRLLVTSHRPLALTALAALHPAPSGVAVAMGHPSLAGDLTRFLGAGWRVGQVYDCDVADLEPESTGPVQ
ncbi:MAG: glycoside hydrolase family 3 protein [bacterium]|nr:glycoside hydrolase family 3 protein [bacterium]